MTKMAVWPDGDWCLLDEIEEFTWKSDDYVVCDSDGYVATGIFDGDNPEEDED
jgi:hypothetical protein